MGGRRHVFRRVYYNDPSLQHVIAGESNKRNDGDFGTGCDWRTYLKRPNDRWSSIPFEGYLRGLKEMDNRLAVWKSKEGHLWTESNIQSSDQLDVSQIDGTKCSYVVCMLSQVMSDEMMLLCKWFK